MKTSHKYNKGNIVQYIRPNNDYEEQALEIQDIYLITDLDFSNTDIYEAINLTNKNRLARKDTHCFYDHSGWVVKQHEDFTELERIIYGF